MNEIVAYNASAQLAVCEPFGSDYTVQCGSGVASLKRDVDFGVVPGTKSPSLYKSGAEKICMGYGLLQQFEIESKIEDPKTPMFYYMVKCKLVKVVNGIEYVFSSGYGSANTNEKRNGRSSAFDSANATLKMAEKRALVDAALHISGLSDAFSQDMENENFMKNADSIIKETPDSPISKAQVTRLYAVAGDNGITQGEAKKIVIGMGYASTKDIPQKDYNTVINTIKNSRVNDHV